ncbi:MAG: hypothetical protein U5K76_16180 [Woeseiaceae bacterium]|nr:hypothetical protein [Woeseiaceae bacterium]
MPVTSASFLLLVATLFAAPVLGAEAHDSRAGHGEVGLTLQYISVDGFEGSLGNVPLGEVQTQVVNIDVDYHLTDRLTLVAGIPFVRERYLGPFDHDPLALDPPRTDVPNVDLGDWNTDFQDFHLGVRYLLKESPQLIIEPFAVAGIPSNDYPFFGHAAIGRNRAQLDIGSSFIYRPPISDAWYRLDLSYVFVEKTLGVSINHLNAHAEAGYFFSRRLSGRLFVLYRDGSGLDFPVDFPPPAERTDEMWYQHDRLVRHNFTNAGAGVDWLLNDRYRLSTSVFTMLRAVQIHDVEYAISVSLSRSF